ncbi:MAG: VOC family protein [Gammaproteobacteria bacterium]|nr:VOC family protein [Gammaproteobacteria bacterium]
MLKSIAIVTLVVRSIAPVEDAYEEHLQYTVAERGEIGRSLARTWNTPAMRGRDYVLMQPASGAPVYLRLVEAAPGTPEVEPFRSSGWTATELLVTDPDALAASFDEAPIRVIGPPRDLMPVANPPRAFQALGPANEPFYFTRFLPGGSGLDLGRASTPVDRVFIAVVGGADLDALRAFWGRSLGLPLTEFGAWQIGVVARAWDLPPDTRFALAGAALPKDFMIELDDYPDEVAPRPRPRGALPGGWAMVTFTVERLDALELPWQARPRRINGRVYEGRRVATATGPAGEIVELIETN